MALAWLIDSCPMNNLNLGFGSNTTYMKMNLMLRLTLTAEIAKVHGGCDRVIILEQFEHQPTLPPRYAVHSPRSSF